LKSNGGSSLLLRRRCLDVGGRRIGVIAKIQPNKKEYKIILRLNDQKKEYWRCAHTYM
jgi:hypothetical protein